MNFQTILLSLVVLLATNCAEAQVADAGSDQEVCGAIAVLQGNAPGAGQTGSWQSVIPGALFMDPFLENTPVGNLTFGPNDLVWTLTDGITSTADTVAIWAYDAAMPFADAGPDQLIVAPPNFAYLSGSTPIAPAVCFWTVVSGACTITDPTDPNTMVTDLGIGWNVLNWNCDNGPCGSSTDQVTIQMMLSTGIEDASNGQQNFFVYNAGSRELNVLNGTTVNAFEVFDSRGRCINRTNAGVRTVSMVDQPEGFYVARAMVDDQLVSLRFVLDH
ncbi:MAG: hypothetical protein IPO90_04370 [Flavobacteriales bacterium]|nr:hypothetical protein [Flavobacteriales bacterium]